MNRVVLVVLCCTLHTVLGEITIDPCADDSTGTISLFGKCFVYIKQSFNWQEAQNYCQTNFYSGTLAEPVTDTFMKATMDFLVSLRVTSFVWLGANDVAEEGHFVWASDNSTVTSKLWLSRQPDNTNGSEDCVMIWYKNNANKSLNDWSCMIPEYFLCQTGNKILSPCLINISGAILISGKCFVLVSQAKTWQDSMNYCQLNYFNGTLAEPTTDLDMKATMEFVTSLNINRNVWIGANDIEVEGRFLWASDNSTMYSTLWDGQQPDNFNNEDCLAMYYYGNNKILNDYLCSARLNSICQTVRYSLDLSMDMVQCFKYFDQQLTWEQAKVLLLHPNPKGFVIPTNPKVLLFDTNPQKIGLSVSTAWLGATNASFWFPVPVDRQQQHSGQHLPPPTVNTTDAGSKFILWTTSTEGVVVWVATNVVWSHTALSAKQDAEDGFRQDERTDRMGGTLAKTLRNMTKTCLTQCNTNLSPCLINISGAILISGKCFVLVSQAKTWLDSLIYCQLNYFNGTLAEPTTDLDMKATMEFVTSLNINRNVWIGANDIEVEGRFVWASDNITMYSTLWDGQQPDNFNNEDCLAMYMYSNNKSLNDYVCSAPLKSICQTDPCSSIFPGAVYGYGQCFKYFDQQLTWEQAKETCLSMNSHLAEPETVQMQQLLQFYLSNKTAWLGATNASFGFQFLWIISNNTVASNFRLPVNNTDAGSRFILWTTTTAGVVGWVATNGLEPHGFVCQTAAVAPNPRMYVAVFPKLSMDRSNLGKLLVTSSFTKVMYLTLQFNYSPSLQKTKTFPLAKLRWVHVTLSGKVFLNSTDVYEARVEITASQPVSIVQYITDQSLTVASSTLLYPVAACNLECAAMTSYLLVSTSPFKNDTDFILTVTSLLNLTTEVTLVLNAQETERVISLGSNPVSLSNVDSITTSLDSLYQSLKINMKTNLDGTYLYSTQPVQVLLATSAKISGQISFDSSLDELLPLTHISHEYFIFSTTQERKTVVRCQAVYGWTLITWVCHVTLITRENEDILIREVGATYELVLESNIFSHVYGNTSFYAYQIHSGNRQDVCVTTLLPSSLWRDEYQFVQVSDSFTATVYIIVDVNMTNDINASGINLAWRCQNITGANYAGCLAVLPKNVTYLYLQLTNRQRRFGAYVIGSNQVSTFCHPLGTGDMETYNGSD
ncbi:hypothetical protein Btru_063090, partial [Bulinus truncatus]